MMVVTWAPVVKKMLDTRGREEGTSLSLESYNGRATVNVRKLSYG